MHLVIRSTDPDTIKAAQEDLESLLYSWGAPTPTATLTTETPDTNARIDAGTVIAVLNLVLDIPGAILATRDLVDRLTNRPRAEALIEAAAKLPPGTTLELRTKDTYLNIRTATPDTILDSANNNAQVECSSQVADS